MDVKVNNNDKILLAFKHRELKHMTKYAQRSEDGMKGIIRFLHFWWNSIMWIQVQLWNNNCIYYKGLYLLLKVLQIII